MFSIRIYPKDGSLMSYFPFVTRWEIRIETKLFIQIHIPAHKYYLNQGCASIPCLSCRITKNFSWYHSIRFVLLFWFLGKGINHNSSRQWEQPITFGDNNIKQNNIRKFCFMALQSSLSDTIDRKGVRYQRFILQQDERNTVWFITVTGRK